MQPFNLKNILVQAMNPRRLPVMLDKIRKRVSDESGTLSREANLAWIRGHVSDCASLMDRLDPELSRESHEFHSTLERDAHAIFATLDYKLGGGGIYPLLYFLTRYTRPETVVETGVAAGFSSRAFLAAIDVNGAGRLYSTDFPYFRLPNPERYIGVLVPESLKGRWELDCNGDRAGIPRILSNIRGVDIFHYDSDKSYSGRRMVAEMIEPRMTPGGIIIMDDIQDNSFFHDFLIRRHIRDFHVFEFEGKYVGVIGMPGPDQRSRAPGLMT